MSKRFLLLAAIMDHDKLVPATESLSSVPGVAWWHAVDGHINLVIRCDGDAALVLNHLNAKAGQMPVSTCEILSDGASLPPRSSDDCRAWVFVDTERSHLDVVRRKIETLPGVAYVLSAKGGCDIAAIITGPTSAAIDRLINEQIRPLDGILRLKQNHIIDLTTL